MFPFAAVGDTLVVGGAGGLVLALAGYLFKELRRKDDGVWAIIADKDRQLANLVADRDYWRDRMLAREDAMLSDLDKRRRQEGKAP